MDDPVAEEAYARALLLAGARGHQQRVAAEARLAEPLGGGDPVCADGYLLTWGYGLASAEEVHVDALNAYKAGARGGCLEQLAKLVPGHCAQGIAALVRRLLGHAIIPMVVILIPLFVAKGTESALPEPSLCAMGFLLPHIWFHWLFKNYRKSFFKIFVGCRESGASARIKAFWENVHPMDPRRNTFLMGMANFATKCIPIGVHGDGVPCTKKGSLDVLSMFGLLGVGKTAELVLYLASYYSKCEVDAMTQIDFPDWHHGETQDQLWTVLIWSFIALETGRFPMVDHRGMDIVEEPWKSLAGTRIADGYVAQFWQFRSDAEFTYNHLGLPGHWSSHNPCHACQCDNKPDTAGSPMHHLNFSPTMSWPSTLFLNMIFFFAHCALKGKSVHVLLRPRSEGGLGLHILCFGRDSLHCLDLGVSQHINGCVLWLLVFGSYVRDGKPLEALGIVYRDICREYARLKTKSIFTNLELSMFCDPDAPKSDYPLLKGKAAETRHLVEVLYNLWASKYTREHDPAVDAGDRAHDAHVSEVLRTLSEINAVLDMRTEPHHVPLFLTEAASDDLRDLINRFLTHHDFLEGLSNAAGVLLWHGTSKFHSLWHLGYESQFSHPASQRTYLNEDYMRIISKVGLSNRHGVAATDRSKTICEKVSLGRSIEFWIQNRS
jgi:hypothetical protein